MGAGLLLGTALSVIIPEGVQTLNMAYTGHTDHHHEEGGEDGENPAHHLIGVSLVLGFIFMLIIDQLASASKGDVEGGRGKTVNWTATLGLVVHAAADGIALGAAATTNQTDVEMIVFLAIMLHKAPASFGLVTFLLHEGLDKGKIRKHLLIFSVAAPSAALVTFVLLQARGSGSMDTIAATGLAMLFSAGTFLYVVRKMETWTRDNLTSLFQATVHVLPEVTSLGHSHGSDKSGGFSKSELFMLILGAVLPLFLSVGHHH